MRQGIIINSNAMLCSLGGLNILLCICYLLVHSALMAVSQKGHSSRHLAVNYFLMIGFVSLLAWSPEEGGRLWSILRLWLPVVFFWWAYKWAGHTLDALFPEGFSFDPRLIELEEKLFGQPSLHWARSRSLAVTEVAHWFYFSYYFYTLGTGAVLHVWGRLNEFQEMTFAILLGYLVSYSLFAVIPVWGPRWGFLSTGQLRPEEQRLEGFAMTGLMNRVMYGGLAHKGGAMPSSHSSTAVVFLYWCWDLWGLEGGLAALVIVVGMGVGAVYGRYHYVIDVICGTLLGVASIAAASWIFSGLS